MMRISSWGRLACSLALACFSACAAGKQSRSTAPTKAGQRCEMCLDSPASGPARASEEGAPPAAPPPEPPAAAAPSAPPTDVARREPPAAADPHSASGARVRLSDARRELEIATSERDCARACRALESMERAARQLCDLARSPDERRGCVSAGEQVDKAKAKVQNACGGCSQNFR